MQVTTILNRISRFKSFVFVRVIWSSLAPSHELEVEIRPRANSKPICSGCQQPAPGYDRLPERRFTFVPLWNIAVFFSYAMRRVHCPQCGVTVEMVPWSDGKSPHTNTFRWFLARWARRLSWREAAAVFHVSWESVFRAVEMAVAWGLKNRNLDGIEAIGVDEILWHRGHKYLTVVYQIEAGFKRLLWVGKERTEQTFLGFFSMLGQKRTAGIRFVCSDMWPPYLKIVALKAKGAIHVLDRFHIMSRMNKAIDEIRAKEAKRLKRDGYRPVLKHSRWCLLKRPENLTDRQTVKLKELLGYNLRAVRAYLLREDFQRFWLYRSPYWAGRFLKEWCTRAMRSKLEPMKLVARTIRCHEQLILNWFRARGTISAAAVEGLNNKVKLVMRRSYGFRTQRAIEIALYHNLGRLPEPHFTHEFC
jgi:transposase